MGTRIATGLHPIENNPVPEGAVVGAIETADGMALRCARWEAAGPVGRGTVGVLWVSQLHRAQFRCRRGFARKRFRCGDVRLEEPRGLATVTR